MDSEVGNGFTVLGHNFRMNTYSAECFRRIPLSNTPVNSVRIYLRLLIETDSSQRIKKLA